MLSWIKDNHWVHRFLKMVFIFDKKGKPHDSVAATLKTVMDGLVWKLRLTLKIRKEATKWAFKNNSSKS